MSFLDNLNQITTFITLEIDVNSKISQLNWNFYYTNWPFMFMALVHIMGSITLIAFWSDQLSVATDPTKTNPLYAMN